MGEKLRVSDGSAPWVFGAESLVYPTNNLGFVWPFSDHGQGWDGAHAPRPRGEALESDHSLTVPEPPGQRARVSWVNDPRVCRGKTFRQPLPL